MEPIQQKQATANAGSVNPVEKKVVKKEGISEKLDNLIKKLDYKEMKKETDKEKKEWNLPFKWKKTLNKSSKSSAVQKVLCFFINKKGELESPVLLPIYNGNTLIYKYTVHEIDPRDILTFTHRKKFYKVLIYRLMDRKAVSNRDYADVKKRGDSTIDDEVFIKAMLTAKASQIAKQQIGKGALVVGGLVLVGVIIWIFSRG